MRGSTAMIEKERQSELIRKFVVSQEMPDDEIGDLSLDELTYIYFNTEIAKKDEKYKAIHFPIKQQIIYWGFIFWVMKLTVAFSTPATVLAASSIFWAQFAQSTSIL